MSDPLEIDHRTDFAKGGPTSLDNLARLCPFHHDLKTHKHWKLEGGPGNWRFERPDPPGSQHPEHMAQRGFEQSEDPEAGEQNPDGDEPTAAARNGAARARKPDDGKAGSTNGKRRANRATGPPGQSTLL